jgi:micrococcal nuclease
MVSRASDDGADPAAEPETVAVDRVVDGDTAKVFYRGTSEYVRYIGIDTPEVGADGQCFGEEATEANESLLGDGEVELKFGPELRDRFGRLLAYVYVNDVMLNAELLRGGFAETLTISPNDAFSARFDQIEAEAEKAGRGLWGACS